MFDALRLARESLAALPAPVDVVKTALVAQLDALRTTLNQTEAGAIETAPQLLAADTQLTALIATASERIDSLATADGESVLDWLHAAARSLDAVRSESARPPDAWVALETRMIALTSSALATANGMDFEFLLDPQRRLLSIGYRVAEGTLDPSCYDLLASEARLASFFAIAKDDVPSRHWFRLGRPVTGVGCGAALLSWSGSMFEYLMPSLVMRAPRGSLLDETSILIVRRQMSHAAALGVPWGISESAYNARDVDLTYQYSNFGVPGLGLKRGLSANIVIAPYATALAAMVRPKDAATNLRRLASLRALGRYGFYESIDYTRSRLPEGEDFVIVRAYMAHHQGMTILAIGNVLMDGIMRTRFHREPCIQATELLLQERTPRDVSVAHPRAEEVRTAPLASGTWLPIGRHLSTPHDATPQVKLLSNGRYAVMLTAAGSGYSRWRGLAVTRWREDATRDDSGSYLFLRDTESGRIWSPGYQPSSAEPDRYEVTFSEDRAEFVRHDTKITTTLTIVVSPEDDAEVRHLSMTNHGTRARMIEVTSYLELALAPPAADAAHPAFSKMFVQTEYVAPLGALLATRRRRQPDEPSVWVAHQSVVEGMFSAEPEYETDRARFVGRGRELCVSPAALDGGRLSNTVGTVLDPIFSLRHRIRVPAGTTARIAFWTSAASTREGLLELVDKLRDANAFERAGTVTENLKMLTRMIGEDIDLVMVPGPALGAVRADPGQIDQVIVDLAVNARDAMPRAAGSPSTPPTSCSTKTSHALHQPVVPGDYVMLSISDTGVGMDSETQSRIFEPFFTTKGARARVSAFPPSTASSSKVEPTSCRQPASSAAPTFRAYFPRADVREEAVPAQESTGLPRAERGQETILLVEDEPSRRSPG